MFDKFFESLYNKVFVNVIVDRLKTTVYIEVCNKRNVVESAEEVFKTTFYNAEMKAFISQYTAETPFNYITFLDTSVDQGAVPTCVKNKTPLYRDLSASITKCYDDKWTFYSSQEELYALERKYDKLGIDFIFSPFTILASFFKDKTSKALAMYILVQDGFISLSIFNESELLYAEHLDLKSSIENEEMLIYDDIDEDLDLDLGEDGIELDDISAIEEIDSFEDFGDIEDLDSIEDAEDFLESTDVEEKLHENLEEEELPLHEEEGFNEDYQRFLLIQSSINEYYKDLKYDSEFIQNVYIADGVGVSQDLKRYLEEEMFLDVYVRQIDLASSVGDLARVELGYEV